MTLCLVLNIRQEILLFWKKNLRASITVLTLIGQGVYFGHSCKDLNDLRDLPIVS